MGLLHPSRGATLVAADAGTTKANRIGPHHRAGLLMPAVSPWIVERLVK